MNFEIKENILHYYTDLLREKSHDEIGKSLHNVIRTMRLSRHDKVCGENFSRLDFGNIPFNGIHFSLNGEYFCDFSKCKLNELNFMSGHSSMINAISYVNNRNEIITCSSGNIIVWDIDSGLVKLEIDDNAISIIVSKDEDVFVTGSCLGVATLRDVKTGEVLQTFKGHKDFINSVFFTNTEQQIVTASSDGKTILWDVKTGKIVKEFIVCDRSIYSSAIFPDGRRIVVAYDDGIVRIFDIETGNVIKEYSIHDKAISSLVILQDGRRIITASDDGTAILWDIDSGNIIRKFVNQDNAIKSIAIAPDGRKLLTGSLGGKAILWDINSGNIIWEKYCEKYISSVVISPDGEACLISDLFGDITSHDMKDGKIIQRYRGHKSFSSDGALIQNSTQLLLFSNDPIVTLWDLKTGKLIRKFKEHSNFISSFSIVPEEKKFITASFDGTIIFWDISTGRAANKVYIQYPIYSISFLPNKNKLLISTDDNSEILWNIETQKEDLKFEDCGSCSGVFATAISPDEKIAIIVYYENDENGRRSNSVKVCFFNLEDGKLVYSFSHTGFCTIDFSSDAKECVLSFLENNIVIFLDIITWKIKRIDCSIKLYDSSITVLWKNKERIILIRDGKLERYLYSWECGVVTFNHEMVILRGVNHLPLLLSNITDLNIRSCRFSEITTNNETKRIIYQQGGEI